MVEPLEQGAIKVIEIIGVSIEGFDDAVQQAVSKASQSINGITGVEVVKTAASVKDGKITQYTATVKLAFVVR